MIELLFDCIMCPESLSMRLLFLEMHVKFFVFH